MTSPTFHDPGVLLRILQPVMLADFGEQLFREQTVRRRGIYTIPVVVMLMIYQRLNGKRTLSSAVHWLAQHADSLQPASERCKRVKEGRISSSTGGYCQARQKMPTLVAERVTDHIFEQLQAQLQEQMPEVPRPVFVVDGSSLRMPHEKELTKSFPPGHNQHGDNHWPVMRIVVFHNVHTGVATRPSWGPMYGRRAVSEQELAEQALQRLPPEAVVLGDANFGIFAFAHAVQQTQRAVLLRLTVSRAHKVLGQAPPRIGRRVKVIWEASRWDRHTHPNLPAEARVTGWLVSCRNPGKRSEILYFFTTLDLKPSKIVALYKLRWNIETDLRSLKSTVALRQLSSKDRAMAEKELMLAVAAYNVVRAVQCLAAHSAGLTPRQLSFSAAQDAVMAAWPDLQSAPSPTKFRTIMDRVLPLVARAKLPKRRRKRSYPREIWGHGGQFPSRGSSPSKGAGA